MGFGMKFPVLQLAWTELLTAGILSNKAFPRDHVGTDRGDTKHSAKMVYLAENTADAIPYYDCDFVNPFVLVVGSEAEGISDEVLILFDLHQCYV